MSGEKHVDKSGLKTPISMPDSTMKLAENNKGQPRMLSNSTAYPGAKANDRPPSVDQSSVYYPPTGFYEYYYPGYGATFGQADDKGYYATPGGSQTSDNNASLLYYLPSYGPYTTEYLQQPYGSEAFSCYTYDGTYSGNGLSGGPANNKLGPSGAAMGPSGSGKSTVTAKPSNVPNKAQTLPYSSKVQHSPDLTAKSIYQNPLDKLGYGFDSSGFMKGYQPATKFSPLANQNMFMQYNPMNYYQSNGRSWNNSNYRYKNRENFVKNTNIEASTELTRGPRSESRSTSPKLPASKETEQSVERNAYNLQDFKIEYDEAKFFVIKSYSEDDVHKCIKYDVWSSTPIGNKKLDAAFQEAVAKAGERGQKCPVFLFFSVNGSGQFVGVAEMTGRVDFAKNMDFWQLDKWTGSFPIKWHIIKDVPNTLLKHITLENNENRPVTYSRDTQEIGLKQGLEMLSIFKKYSIRTSVLDDFNFYEDRENKLKSKRNAKQANTQSNGHKSTENEKQMEAGEGKIPQKSDENSTTESTKDVSTLASLTQNLSLNSQPPSKSVERK